MCRGRAGVSEPAATQGGALYRRRRGRRVRANAGKKTLGYLFRHQVGIDNRGGASGIIGTEITAKAAPDDYTIAIMEFFVKQVCH